MADVFISYSREDLSTVSILAQRIKEAGYSLWWDADLPAHKNYGDVIMEKIVNAKAAVVLWSPSAMKSEWVRAEADMARNESKLVQAALGDLPLPLPFNQIQFADLGNWEGEPDHPGWIKIKESLAELCPNRTPVEAQPIIKPAENPAPSAKVQAGAKMQAGTSEKHAKPTKPASATTANAPKAKSGRKPSAKKQAKARRRIWARRTRKVMSETIDLSGLALIAALVLIVFGWDLFGMKADEQTARGDENPVSIADPQNEPPVENLSEQPQITPQPLTQVESPSPSEIGVGNYEMNGEEVIIDPLGE